MVRLLIAFFLATASVIDVKTRKVPNALTFPAFLLGVLITVFSNPKGIVSTIICCFLLFGFGCIGGAGWGDIKALMVVCALGGWKDSIACLVLGCVAMVVFHYIRHPYTRKQDFSVSSIALLLAGSGTIANPSKYPFAPFMLIGYLVYVILKLIF